MHIKNASLSPAIEFTVMPLTPAELVQSGKIDWISSGTVQIGSRACSYEILQSRGKERTLDDIEDGLFTVGNKIAVFDGTSSPHSPTTIIRKFIGELGDGAYALKIVQQKFSEYAFLPVDDLVIELSEGLRKELGSRGYKFETGGSLPGLCGIIGELKNEEINLRQWGDGIAVVKYRDGTIKALNNQIYKEDKLERPYFEQLLKTHNGYGAAWDIFAPELLKLRDIAVNNVESFHKYGVMNGQRSFFEFVREWKIELNAVEWIFIGTDGLIPFEETETPEKLGAYVSACIEHDGLTTLLKEARYMENVPSVTGKAFTSTTEATGFLLKT